MSEQPSEALRRALNEMEYIGKRSLLVTRLTLYSSIACFTVCILMFLFSQNKWLGAVWGIISLFTVTVSVAIYISGLVCASTLRILKAIEVIAGTTKSA
jgi:hypothetical protein